MLQANYRLVISICRQYQHKGIGMQVCVWGGVLWHSPGAQNGVASREPKSWLAQRVC
jgi:hypothetical protein